jgi:enoyl-CoA hydratase/carnithine racemase
VSDVTVERADQVAVVELHWPPHNVFHQGLLWEIASATTAAAGT